MSDEEYDKNGLRPAKKNEISDDFVPLALRGHVDEGDHARQQETLANLMGETNKVFAEMGITVSSNIKPNAKKENKPKEVCSGCNKEISGRVLQALDKHWHPDCFVCSQCNRPVEMSGEKGAFLVRGDKPWCTKCDEWDKKENKNKPNTGNMGNTGKGKIGNTGDDSKNSQNKNDGKNSSAKPANYSTGYTGGDDDEAKKIGKLAHANALANAAIEEKNKAIRQANADAEQLYEDQMKAHKRIAQGKEICPGCSTVIEGEGVEFDKKFYHPFCLLCNDCSDPLETDEGVMKYQGMNLHPKCYRARLVRQCEKCHKDIVSKFVIAEGKKYHKECFICSTNNCKGDMGQFAIKNGKPWCADCAKKNFSTTTEINRDRFVQGIRFNQVSRDVTTVAVGPIQSHDPRQKLPDNTKVTTTGGTKPKFCTKCGTATGTGNFCTNCGEKL